MNGLVSPLVKARSSRNPAVRRTRISARRVALITMTQTSHLRSAALVALIGAAALPLNPLLAQDATVAPAPDQPPAASAPAMPLPTPPAAVARSAAPAASGSDSASSSLFPKVAVPNMAPAVAATASDSQPAAQPLSKPRPSHAIAGRSFERKVEPARAPAKPVQTAAVPEAVPEVPPAAAPIAAPAAPAPTPAVAQVPTQPGPVPAAARTTHADEKGNPAWVLLAAGAVILAVLAGVVAMLRRRKEHILADEYILPEGETAAAVALDERPWIRMMLQPVAAESRGEEQTVDYELIIENEGHVPARNVRVSSFLAHGDAASAMPAQTRHVDIGPGASVPLPGRITVPEGVDPKIVADARYPLPDGSQGRLAALFGIDLSSPEAAAQVEDVLERA